jgi:hypothetical protein
MTQTSDLLPLLQGALIWNQACVPQRRVPRFELTDLIRFQDAWYCGFREGDIHDHHPSGRARVIRSADGARWESVALFQWDGADVREPSFSVTAEGTLMVSTAIRFVSRGPRERGHYYNLESSRIDATDEEAQVAMQSVNWLSPDGRRWSSAHACPTGINSWRWQTTWHNGMGYSVGYAGRDRAGTLYRTRDGRQWRALGVNVFPNGQGNEMSLAFDEQDHAIALLRDAQLRSQPADVVASDGHQIERHQSRRVHGGALPMIGFSKAPYYQDWQWRELRIDWDGQGPKPAEQVLAAPFGGPKLMRLRDGRFVAVARVLAPGLDDGAIVLFHVDPQRALLTRWTQCAGTTYGGVQEHDGQLWISYGARDVSGIHLARVAIP